MHGAREGERQTQRGRKKEKKNKSNKFLSTQQRRKTGELLNYINY